MAQENQAGDDALDAGELDQVSGGSGQFLVQLQGQSQGSSKGQPTVPAPAPNFTDIGDPKNIIDL